MEIILIAHFILCLRVNKILYKILKLNIADIVILIYNRDYYQTSGLKMLVKFNQILNIKIIYFRKI